MPRIRVHLVTFVLWTLMSGIFLGANTRGVLTWEQFIPAMPPQDYPEDRVTPEVHGRIYDYGWPKACVSQIGSWYYDFHKHADILLNDGRDGLMPLSYAIDGKNVAWNVLTYLGFTGMLMAISEFTLARWYKSKPKA